MRNKWNRASPVFDFKRNQLNQLIAPAFSKSSVVDWQQTEGGLANTNIRLRLTDRQQPILLRLFVRDPKQSAKEWNINNLVRHSVPSPEFIYFAAENPFTAHPYILMEWIDALPMDNLILDLPAKDVENIGQSVGSALAAIHSHKFEHAGFFDAELNVKSSIDLGSSGLIAYAKHCLIDGIGGERLGKLLTHRLLDFLNSEAPLLDEWRQQPCLTHSDYGGSNILVSKHTSDWRVAAVLDWEFAFSGTPFFDFGNLLRAPYATIPRFEEAVCESYQLAGGQLPARWRQLSLLTDLTAWMEFLTRNDPGVNLINDAQRVISQTIDNWNSIELHR